MSSAHVTVTELALRGLGAARADLRAASRGSFAAGGERSVHEARVALRKLRVYVRLFRSRLGARRAAQLAAELRWLFRQLGTLRDLQIFGRAHLPRAGGAGSLRTRVAQRIRAARQELRASQDSARFVALMRALEELESELRGRDDAKPARRWLARRLQRDLEKITRLQPKVVLRGDATLHALRKKIKRLRYELELWQDVDGHHGKRARRFELSLIAVQDLLGAWNDLRSAQAIANELGTTREARATSSLARDAACAAYLASLPNALAILAAAKTPWR